MSGIRHCFIDLDGVLVDFASAACRAVGQPHHADTGFREWPAGEWEMADVFGITQDEFWRAIDAGGSEWWSGLEPYPWHEELLSLIPKPFTVSTSPSRNPACASGKVAWMRQHIASHFQNYLIGREKHLLAKFDTLLIDDNDKKVAEFRAAGGKAILFPQPWNANHALTGDRLTYVADEIGRLKHESVLEEAQRLVHGDRQAAYGHPSQDFERIGRIWAAILGVPEVTAEQVALCMVGVKISREVNRPKRDNRVDGAGYFETLDMIHRREEA